MLHGAYPTDLFSDTASITDWSFIHPGDLTQIAQSIDLLGVNYYATTAIRVWDGVSERESADGHKPAAGTAWPGADRIEFLQQDGPYTDMGWNIDPSGLEDLLMDIHREFPTLPLMITENGAAFADTVTNGEVHDPDRTDYIRNHVAAMHSAMESGVDVRGYFVWSLLDNFEWGYGYSKRFGIVRVDYETLERTVKDSGAWYARLAREHALPPSM